MGRKFREGLIFSKVWSSGREGDREMRERQTKYPKSRTHIGEGAQRENHLAWLPVQGMKKGKVMKAENEDPQITESTRPLGRRISRTVKKMDSYFMKVCIQLDALKGIDLGRGCERD